MAINLSNLNISLDKFNAVSGGDYNIGQMKLSSDGKSIYRANNHKTWTIFNWTKISSEEALAVKFAFCKALSKEGLSKDAIDAVKAKLGISGNALEALKAGNIKPLTAAEVREVIDQYAGQINQNRASAANGAKMLKTSKELYRNALVDKAADLLNAVVAANPPKVENARAEKSSDDGIMKAINELESGEIDSESLESDETEPEVEETQKNKGGMSNEALLGGLDKIFKALKEARGPDERRVLRDANMDAVVRALQQALDKARYLDDRNTKLVNNVREAFYGNPNIDTDDLFREISDVLNKKRVDFSAKVDEDIRKFEENIKNNVENDFDKPLNINEWLGAD